MQGPTSSRVDWVKTLAGKGRRALAPSHLQYRPLPVGSNTLHCVVLDMSASMLRGEKLALAKGCLLALTELFYRRRERMAVIGFAGAQAQLLQAPAKVAAFNAAWIAPLQGGGGTPVQSAMAVLEAVLTQQKAAQAGLHSTVWLLTDGRFDPLPARPAGADACHIVDFENDAVALRRCERLALSWDAHLVLAQELERVGEGPLHALSCL